MIGILIFPDFQLLDAAGPISVFEIAGRFSGVDQSIRTLAVTPGPVRSSSGVEMLARGLKSSGAISTLIVAGGEGVRTAATCKKTLAFVRAMTKRGVRVASVCSGAYILAEAGLLDGRRATTHWQRTRHFLKTYPNVKLEPDRIFVRDGNIWSSAGISAGIDLALAMAAGDFGDEVAQQTARQLVLYHRRSGGQSQFSSLLELKAPAGRFGPLLAWAREHLDAPLTVEDMVDRVSRSGADAPRLHPRLRPAAAIAAARGPGGLGRELIFERLADRRLLLRLAISELWATPPASLINCGDLRWASPMHSCSAPGRRRSRLAAPDQRDR